MAIIYKTKTDAINALIKIEKNEEGYLEKASNKNLDSKTANAGSGNYTKYWRDLAEIGLMGQDKTFAGGPVWYWCAGFQTWAFINAFGAANAKKLLLHTPYTSCSKLGELAKSKKQLFDTPEVGDVILFWNGSRFYHTGLVIAKTRTSITTIEGNTNSSKKVIPNGGSVCVKTYTISACKKNGHKFFRPDYSVVVGKSISSTTAKKTTSTTTTTTTTKKTTTTAKKKSEAIINVKGSSLRCRKEPSSTGAILGAFSRGDTVELLEETTKTWWKVKGKTSDGKTITGYSASQYLKKK